jgi:hypothetical protein
MGISNLPAYYLADRAPKERCNALYNDESGQDQANLTGSDFEFGLDLLDSSFEFEMMEFSVVGNAASA